MRNMSRLFLVVSLILLAYMTRQDARSADPSDQIVHRKVQIEGLRFPGGNVTEYRIPLERDTLYVREIDNNRGFSVGSPLKDNPQFPSGTPQLDAFNVEVRKDEKGRISNYVVVLGEMRYFDLNGDGRIDRTYDTKTSRSQIILEGRFLDVQNTLDHGRSAKSADGKVRYTFRENAWQLTNQ